MEEVCPNAWIFNYTNPVNIVAEAITHNSPIKIVSLCEGPIYFRDTIAESAGLDPALLEVDDGRAQPRLLERRARATTAQDPMPAASQDAWERRRDDPTLEPVHRRQLQLAVAMGAIPADYFQYYYFTDEVLAELPRQADDARRGHPRLVDRLLAPLRASRRRPTTRSSIPPARAAASTSSSSRST